MCRVARIVSWNISNGGGNRVDAIADAVDRLGPDIAVVSEFRSGARGDVIRARLADRGLVHQVPARASRGKNSVLLATSYEATSSPIDIPSSLAAHVVCVAIGDLTIIGAFCATPSVASEFVKFLEAVTHVTGVNALALGDFYHGPRGSDARGGRSLKRALDAGWQDLWERHRGAEDCWSFRSTRGGVSRPDHAWSSGNVGGVIASVGFSHAELDMKLSDHAPMVVELSPSAIGPHLTLQCIAHQQPASPPVDAR